MTSSSCTRVSGTRTHRGLRYRTSETFTRTMRSVAATAVCFAGRASVAAVGAMCLTGRIKVRWFRYHDLQQFASSFDYSTPTWIQFYRGRGQEDAVHALLVQQWRLALASGKLVSDNGSFIDPASIAPEDAARLKESGFRLLALHSSSPGADVPSDVPEKNAAAATMAPVEGAPAAAQVEAAAEPGAATPSEDPQAVAERDSSSTSTSRIRVLLPDVTVSVAIPQPPSPPSSFPTAAALSELGDSPIDARMSSDAARQSSTAERPSIDVALAAAEQQSSSDVPPNSSPEWREVMASEQEADMVLLIPQLLQKQPPSASSLVELGAKAHPALDSSGGVRHSGAPEQRLTFAAFASANGFTSLTERVVCSLEGNRDDSHMAVAAAGTLPKTAIAAAPSLGSITVAPRGSSMIDSIGSFFSGLTGWGSDSSSGNDRSSSSGVNVNKATPSADDSGSASSDFSRYERFTENLADPSESQNFAHSHLLAPEREHTRAAAAAAAAAPTWHSSQLNCLLELQAVADSYVTGALLASNARSRLSSPPSSHWFAPSPASRAALSWRLSCPPTATAPSESDAAPHWLHVVSPAAYGILRDAMREHVGATLLAKNALDGAVPLPEVLSSPWSAALLQLTRSTAVPLSVASQSPVFDFIRDFSVGAFSAAASADCVIAPVEASTLVKKWSSSSSSSSSAPRDTAAPSMGGAAASSTPTLLSSDVLSPAIGRTATAWRIFLNRAHGGTGSASEHLLRVSAALSAKSRPGHHSPLLGPTSPAVPPSEPLSFWSSISSMSVSGVLFPDRVARAEGACLPPEGLAVPALAPLSSSVVVEGRNITSSSSSRTSSSSHQRASHGDASFAADTDNEADYELNVYLQELRFRIANEAARFDVEERKRRAALDADSVAVVASDAAASSTTPRLVPSPSASALSEDTVSPRPHAYLTWGPRHPLLVPPTCIPLPAVTTETCNSRSHGHVQRGDASSSTTSTTAAASLMRTSTSGFRTQSNVFGMRLLSSPFACLPTIVPYWMASRADSTHVSTSLQPMSFIGQIGNATTLIEVHHTTLPHPQSSRHQQLPLSSLTRAVFQQLQRQQLSSSSALPGTAAEVLDAAVGFTAMWALGYPRYWPSLSAQRVRGTESLYDTRSSGTRNSTDEAVLNGDGANSNTSNTTNTLDTSIDDSFNATSELGRVFCRGRALLAMQRSPLTLGAVLVPSVAHAEIATSAAAVSESSSSPAQSPSEPVSELPLSTASSPQRGAVSANGVFLLPIWHPRRLHVPAAFTNRESASSSSSPNVPVAAAVAASSTLRVAATSSGATSSTAAIAAHTGANPTSTSPSTPPSAVGAAPVAPWVSSRGTAHPHVYNEAGSAQFLSTAMHRLRLQFEDAMTVAAGRTEASPVVSTAPVAAAVTATPFAEYGEETVPYAGRTVAQLLRLTPLAIRDLARRVRERRLLKVYGNDGETALREGRRPGGGSSSKQDP